MGNPRWQLGLSQLPGKLYLFDELKPSLPVGLIMRESIPRQVDKKSGVPEEEKGFPERSRRRKGQAFFLHCFVLVNMTMYLF